MVCPSSDVSLRSAMVGAAVTVGDGDGATVIVGDTDGAGVGPESPSRDETPL